MATKAKTGHHHHASDSFSQPNKFQTTEKCQLLSVEVDEQEGLFLRAIDIGSCFPVANCIIRIDGNLPYFFLSVDAWCMYAIKSAIISSFKRNRCIMRVNHAITFIAETYKQTLFKLKRFGAIISNSWQ